MNLKTSITSALFLAVAPVLVAEPGERMRGPLPDRQRELIHQMADGHEKIRRDVEMNDKGYTARTTSKDAHLARAIREHFAYMKKRMGSGAMVRRWDPAFVEMVQHHDDIVITEKEIEGGIEVRVEGKTDGAVKVAKNHAEIISGFVRTGDVGKEHRKVLR